MRVRGWGRVKGQDGGGVGGVEVGEGGGWDELGFKGGRRWQWAPCNVRPPPPALHDSTHPHRAPALTHRAPCTPCLQARASVLSRLWPALAAIKHAPTRVRLFAAAWDAALEGALGPEAVGGCGGGACRGWVHELLAVAAACCGTTDAACHLTEVSADSVGHFAWPAFTGSTPNHGVTTPSRDDTRPACTPPASPHPQHPPTPCPTPHHAPSPSHIPPPPLQAVTTPRPPTCSPPTSWTPPSSPAS